MDILYRPLEQYECERIREMDASQYIQNAWRDVNGIKQLVEINWQENDFPNGYEYHLSALKNTFVSDGFVIGAFYNEILVGFGSVNRQIFGNRFKYVLLDQIFISNGYRRKGIGKSLFTHAADKARLWGADKLYICAGSAEDTISFYLALGCVDAQEINQEFFKNDIRDIQLEYDLNDRTLPIKTSRVILRLLNESDAAAIKRLREDEFETEDAALEWIHWANNHIGRYQPFFMFGIEHKQTGEFLGRVYFHKKRELNDELEIAYNIIEEQRNKGYATEAAKAAIWFAFEHCAQDVISAIVKSDNAASRRVIEKLGFVPGGTRMVLDESGEDCRFDYFRFYHTDYLPGPEWDIHTLYKAEPMGVFFDVRADTYNDKMLSNNGIEDYKKLGACFPKTDEPLKILDIGCGTGIELEYIWAQAPNAHITCVDISREMLNLLMSAYPDNHDRITVAEASYIDWTYPESLYDIVVSNMTMHHLFPDEKTTLYRKILSSIISGGCYIEGDFTVDAIAVEQYRRRFEIITANLPDKAQPGEYHIDIPCTVETQEKLLQNAGFKSVEIIDTSINRGNGAIIIAGK